MIKKGKRYIAGVALVLAVGTFLMFVFSLLSRTDKIDYYLMDTSTERFGWRYELLADGHVQTYKPVFPDGGNIVILPDETEAVRITRTMTEDVLGAELQWASYSHGVEVRLNGRLLHSDFPESERGADGFLHPTEAEWDRLHQNQSQGRTRVRMTLPSDYTGGELSLTTYFPEDELLSKVPEYPFFGTEDSYQAQFVVSSFKEYAAAMLYAILTILTSALFLLDIHNNDADSRTLLLCLYFALLFLSHIYDSPAGYYSMLESINVGFLYGIYIAPLYLYLALRLKKWWKYPLCAGITIWFLCECVRRFMNLRQNLIVNYGYTGREIFILILTLAAAFCAEEFMRNKQHRWSRKTLLDCGIAVVITAVYLSGKIRSSSSIYEFLQDMIWAPALLGNFESIVNIITDIVSYMVLIMLVEEVIRRTIQTNRTISILRERERLSVENYHYILTTQEATRAMRHEMRHHFNALAGMLDSGDIQRASSYVASVAGELELLPTGYYSQNMLVNAISGAYLDQARALGIRTEYRLNVPEELAIADGDLSVFLSNMLQNALEACQRMPSEAERYIQIELRLRENFLFIKCVNSKSETESPDIEGRSRPGHGYGLAAMRRIAEKYDGVLLTEPAEKEFEVKSCLCLKAAA